MGGFTFNGCGATDHIKKIKSLGTYMCPRCNRAAEFFISEAKFKVDIFFIPTITLKSRYAVTCGKCKEGEFCSDEWAVHLINSAPQQEIIFESQAVLDAAQLPAQSLPLVQCAHCGVTQPREGAFCSSCGKPLPEERSVEASPEVFCSACGSRQESGARFCDKCGVPIEVAAPVEELVVEEPAAQGPEATPVCPSCGAEIEEGAAFCMECGTKL